MSNDKRVTKDLIRTLEDGKSGFEQAADRLADSDQPQLASKMRDYASERAAMSRELEALAASYGDDIDEDGSVAAAVHRGWMAIKDVVAGSGAGGVLDAAEQGEDHAVAEYEKALKEDISAELRTVLQRQFTVVKDAHDVVRNLRNSLA